MAENKPNEQPLQDEKIVKNPLLSKIRLSDEKEGQLNENLKNTNYSLAAKTQEKFFYELMDKINKLGEENDQYRDIGELTREFWEGAHHSGVGTMRGFMEKSDEGIKRLEMEGKTTSEDMMMIKKSFDFRHDLTGVVDETTKEWQELHPEVIFPNMLDIATEAVKHWFTAEAV